MSDGASGSKGRAGVVLHVDDDADTRASVATFLQLEGYVAHQAVSLTQALDVARHISDDLDVLIVDFHLGGEDTGTDVAEQVARVLRRALPTILLTGDMANVEVPLLTGAPIWLLRKPANPVRLLAALPYLVSLHRALRVTGE